MTESSPRAEHAVHQAAVHLARARRHAIWLERLAATLATFWVAATTYVALGDLPAFAVTWAVVVTLAIIAWAVLRALALMVHLRVDDTMVQLADEDSP